MSNSIREFASHMKISRKERMRKRRLDGWMTRQKKRTDQSTRYNISYLDIKTERRHDIVSINHRMSE